MMCFLWGLCFCLHKSLEVGDLGDEYKDLQGHVLRDMLGGSNATAKAWLEQKGDPNIYDGGTGWTPVLMHHGGTCRLPGAPLLPGFFCQSLKGCFQRFTEPEARRSAQGS